MLSCARGNSALTAMLQSLISADHVYVALLQLLINFSALLPHSFVFKLLFPQSFASPYLFIFVFESIAFYRDLFFVLKNLNHCQFIVFHRKFLTLIFFTAN